MELKGAHVLLTGSNGFIGSHLVNELSSRGCDLINTKHLDILKKPSLLEIACVDAVCHLAAKRHGSEDLERPHLYYETNVTGTLNMLEYCRIKDVKEFVYASTYVYGHPGYLPIDEDHPVECLNPYSRSKFIGEEIVRGYSEDYGINSVILRLFNVYGPGQKRGLVIPTIIDQLNNDTIFLMNGKPRRDFVYVSDVVDAFARALCHNGIGHYTINIGSGVSNSVEAIAYILIGASGSKGKVEYTSSVREGIMDIVADIRKAKRVLGWEPKVSIGEGLVRTLEAKNIISERGGLNG